MQKTCIALLLPAAMLAAPPARAQVVTAGAIGAAALAPHIAAAAPALLTGAVSAGSAHVGQAVFAKLVSSAMLSDGTKLPAGSQLLGRVTQAIPASKGAGKSSLGMVFDRFRLPSGEERVMSSSILKSLGSARGRSTSGDDTASQVQTDTAINAEASAPPQTANRQAASSGGGLLGSAVSGIGNTVGGVVHGVGDTVAGTTAGLGQTINGLTGTLSPNGLLTAQGQNVSLPANTRVTIAASADSAAR